MYIAKIAVAAAVYAIDKPYDYLIPDSLAETCVPGVRVVVPFGQGNRRTEGVVLSVSQGIPEIQLKPVETILDETPVLSETMIRLAAFMRERYFCTFFDAIRAMLPAGLWFRNQNRIILTATGLADDSGEKLKRCPEGMQVRTCLMELGGAAEEADLKRILPPETLESGLRQLRNKKMILFEGNFARKIGDKTEKIAELAVSSEEAMAYAATRRRAPMQKAVLELLAVVGSCAVKELCYFTGASTQSVNALEKAGYVTLSHREVFRRPEFDPLQEAEPLSLMPEQQRAYETLHAAMEGNHSVSLLYGVTGSGKTAVYLKLIGDVLEKGKNALVLVPEIALTPQLMQTFMRYFGDQVAVLHSALQMSQRYDEWKRIRAGKATVVVGTRSAVFAPVQNLGLIVVDEEHETTYKSEMNPRYHAREVAIWRGARERAAVVLGSATPSLETMFLAKSGVYHYSELRTRYNGMELPRVSLVDMKEELRSGNGTSISSVLLEEIQKNLDNGQQTILYLNRRGASRSVVCPQCGYVPRCRRCSVSLTYHSANERLMCHYCGYSQSALERCSQCGAVFRQNGTGTQKVQEELREWMPWVETIRMDADTVSAANPHEKILERFQKERIPILIGTQMVTKGLNFPDVTLVGVLDGDSALYTDDFRASETTFAKITQVVGRAGRGGAAGRALIQTMTPENQVLQQAANQDYDAFYETEIPLRQLQNCPPFSDVFCVHFYGPFESEVAAGAMRFRENLAGTLQNSPLRVTVMGPAPAAVVRVMNRYHYRLTLLAKNNKELRTILSGLLKWFGKDKINKHITATVDVNPLG